MSTKDRESRAAHGIVVVRQRFPGSHVSVTLNAYPGSLEQWFVTVDLGGGKILSVRGPDLDDVLCRLEREVAAATATHP